MKEQETQLWGWMRNHRRWSAFMLLALLAGIVVGAFWTVELVRFGWPPPTGQNCGRVNHSYWRETDRADADLKPLTCFWQAYQTCKAATIIQVSAGTDGGHTETLTIEWRNNRCALYGRQVSWANTDQRTTTFLCTQLSKVGDKLQVSACDGIKPFALAPRYLFESYTCGLMNDSTLALPRGMEECFFTAYQQCFADALGYETVINGVQVERYFYIDNHCNIGYLRTIDTASYMDTCASLELRADGLHFSQCGTDGDIFVPRMPKLLEPAP